MAKFNLLAGNAVFAALNFIALLSILTFWIRSLNRAAPIQSPPMRLARIFLRITPPIFGLYV